MTTRGIRAQRKEADHRKHYSMEPVVWHIGEEEVSEDAPMVLIDGTEVDSRSPWPKPSDVSAEGM